MPSHREPADDTVEEQPPATQVPSVEIVGAGESGRGTVEFDERGQPRWKFPTENYEEARDADSTYNLLKALENAAIVMDEPPAVAPEPSKPGGYNPYDTAPTAKNRSRSRR